MPSTRGADTKLRIMAAAFDLFHKQGVVATSPDEIMAASRTGKGQFYYYFKSKEGLVHEVLRTHLEAIERGASLVKHDVASWDDLEGWFRAHLELQKLFNMTRSCPFGTIGHGVTESDELIRVDLSRIFDAVKVRIAAFFIKEKAQGRLAADANPDHLADFCTAIAQGATFMGKMRRSSEATEIIIREAMTHLRRYATKPRRRRLL